MKRFFGLLAFVVGSVTSIPAGFAQCPDWKFDGLAAHAMGRDVLMFKAHARHLSHVLSANDVQIIMKNDEIRGFVIKGGDDTRLVEGCSVQQNGAKSFFACDEGDNEDIEAIRSVTWRS